jgi:hypothetical protein
MDGGRGGAGMIAVLQLQSPQMLWLAMLALAAALTGVVWLYRPQIKPLPRRWWWPLLALRTLALGVLAMSILRPTVLRAVRIEQRGLIAVLVDQSASMSVVDAARNPPQLVELAAALGEISAELRPASLSNLQRQVAQIRSAVDEVARGSSEREYARLSGRGIEAADQHLRQAQQAFTAQVQALVDSSRAAPQTAGLADALAALNAEPLEPPDSWERAVSERIDQLLERIDVMQSEADQQLYQTNQTARQRCDTLAALPRIELARRAILNESGGGLVAGLGADRPLRFFGFATELGTLQLPLDDIRADGLASDLGGALREARRRLANQRVAGVLILTDGRQVPADANATAPWPDVPVVVVNVASSLTRDLSIRRVALPASAFAGETITAHIDVGAEGFDGSTVQVSLEAAGQRQTMPVQVRGGGAGVDLSFTLDRAGPAEVQFSIAPQSGEATERNNTVRRTIKVIAEKIRVTLIGGVATRDFQQLRAALAGSPRFSLSHYLVDSSHPGPSSAQLLGQDVVVLCELPASALDSQQWDSISRMITEHAGGALLIAGDPTTAASYGAQPLSAALLPWRGGLQPTWRIWRGEDPMFRVVPAWPELPQHIRLSDDPGQSRALFNELPGIFRFVSMPPLKSTTRVLLIDRDSGSPVLTESRLGAGRVVMLGINEVWRWRGALPAGQEDRIWTQLVRFAAQQPYAATDGVLSLDADRLRSEPLGPLHVRARVQRGVEPEPDDPNEPPTLQLVRDNAVLRSEPLRPTIDGPTDRFETTLADLSKGDYELRLLSDTHVVSLPLHVAESDEGELSDISPDPNVRRLVGPRGDVIQLTDLRFLPQRLRESSPAEPTFHEVRLWDSPYLFLLVLGCLGVEWAVRKRVGLA